MAHQHQHILDAARQLLQHGFDSENITAALGIIGRGAGVDRVYVFENSADCTTFSQRFEWSGDVPPQLDNPDLQDMTWDLAPDWPPVLSNDKVLVQLVKEVGPAARALLEAQGIISMLVCPILLDGKWWGFVGFDDCHSERAWPAEEVALLRSFSRSLAAAMRHNQNKSRLEEARQQLRAILAA